MRFLLLLAVLAAAQVSAQTSGQIRYVFKGRPAAFQDAKQMTFGLSAAQAQQISDLTGGRVNLDQYYFVDRDRDLRLPAGGYNYAGHIFPDVPPPVMLSADPELDKEWWIDKLQVKSAWGLATGQGVTIADCDSGFYYKEPDLNANFLMAYAYDFGNPDDPTTVDDGSFIYHGTAVTAIMAGVMNGTGTNGIAFNSKIVPLQNFNYNGKDTLDKEEATAQCILHAIKTPNVNIIVLENQMANGSSEAFPGTRDAVRLALQAGVIVVGAGGNNSVPLDEELKDDTGSIIVGALAQDGAAASFSNFGDRATVAAFGEKLRTLFGPNGNFGNFGGTSGATPQVAATVALMKEVNPLMTPAQARQILQDTRVVSPNNKTVGGMLNTFAAVTKAKQTAVDMPEWSRAWLFRQQLTAILTQ